MQQTVDITIKKDYFAYITCNNSLIFDMLLRSFTRQIRKYNNYFKRYELKENKHYSLINNKTTIKVKAGLIDFLIESLKNRNISYNFKDERLQLNFKGNIIKTLNEEIKLKDFQEIAVNQAFDNPFSCLQLPTGSGKSIISASIIKTYLKTNFNRAVLYVVPTIKLQKEAEKIFKNCNISCTEKGKKFNVGSVTVITYQSLVRSDIPNSEKDKVGCLVIDEMHHLKGNKFSKIVHMFKKLNMCIGLSATVTPDIQHKKLLKQLNDDDFNILGSTGKPAYWKTIEKTTKEKHITPVDITILENKENYNNINIDESKSVWIEIKQKILMSPGRSHLISDFVRYICEKDKYYTLMLLIPEVEWSKQLMEVIAYYGNKNYQYILMFGSDKFSKIEDNKIIEIKSKEEKEELYDNIKNPNVKTIFSATTFAYEGLDIPNLQALINVYGGRSNTRIKQQIGRVTRLFKGKDVGHIYEIYDKHPVFESQLKKRLDIYKNEYKAKIMKSDYGWWEE